jgi:hypothetical protein
VVLYGCKTWSLIHREKYMRGISEVYATDTTNQQKLYITTYLHVGFEVSTVVFWVMTYSLVSGSQCYSPIAPEDGGDRFL